LATKIRPKVLVGIGTCDKFSYIEKHCFDSIRKQTYKDFDVLIVDNSKGIFHYFDLVTKNTDFKVIHIKRARYFRDALAQVRKKIIDYAFFNKYDYLFFADVDHIFEPDTLKKLISHKKDFVSGLIGYLHKETCTIFKNGASSKRYNQYEPYKWKDLEGSNKLIEIEGSGLACALIKTHFLLGIDFHVSHKRMGFGEDLLFCSDLKNKGAKLYCDTSVKPTHAHIFMPERLARKEVIFRPIQFPN